MAKEAKVVLVDPALRDDVGHHRRLAAGYAAAIGPGLCRVAGHHSLRDLPDFPAARLVPAYATSYYELAARERLGGAGLALLNAWRAGRVVADPALRRRLETSAPVRWAAAGGRVLRPRRPDRAAPVLPAPPAYVDETLALIARLSLGPWDHLAFISTESQTALTVLWLLACRDPATLPALHLRFMFDDAGFRTAQADYANLVARLAATGVVGTRLFLYAETTALAAAMSADAGGVAVDLAPYPPLPLVPPDPATGPADPDRPLVLGFLGEARREKGFDQLEGLLEGFARARPDLAARSRAVIHAGGASGESLDLARRFAAWAGSAPLPVEVVQGVLSPAAYAALLQRIDILLCPMDGRVYAARGSGVAQEAAAAGKVVLHPPGLSLAELTGPSGADGRPLEQRLVEAAADYPAAAAAARAAADQVRARFAASPLIARCRAPAPTPASLPARTLLVGDDPSPPQPGEGTRLRIWTPREGADPAATRAAVAALYAGRPAPTEGFLTLACTPSGLAELRRRLADGGWNEPAPPAGRG